MERGRSVTTELESMDTNTRMAELCYQLSILQNVPLFIGIRELASTAHQRDLTKLCRMFMLDRDMFEKN